MAEQHEESTSPIDPEGVGRRFIRVVGRSISRLIVKTPRSLRPVVWVLYIVLNGLLVAVFTVLVMNLLGWHYTLDLWFLAVMATSGLLSALAFGRASAPLRPAASQPPAAGFMQ